MARSDDGALARLTRRDILKGSALAVGGIALGSTVGGVALGPGARRALAADVPDDPTQRYSYLRELDAFKPGTPLEDDELRISFMGSGFPTPRRAQAEMSLFVEVGPWVVPDPAHNPGFGRATDSFVFDCGSGVSMNYAAMGISPSRMDKIFLAHPHGDHMNDLTHIYCFGPAMDRKSPLYVWGSGPSGVKSPRPPRRLYDDGTRAMCAHLREALRWATESFSFQTTSYAGYDTPSREGWVVPDKRGPVSDDPPTDSYALVPIELDWTKYGQRVGDNLAYRNPATGVTITHFPVIHTRKGAIGYRLEWNGLSMVYTSDTKPEKNSIHQGSGADVFIHEMILPADYLTMKTMHLTSVDQVPEEMLDVAIAVQNSSHTPQGAFGYLLSQMETPPRIAVATHFTVSDDTVELAKTSVVGHVPHITCNPAHGQVLDGGLHPEPGYGNIAWSTDLMVLRVFPDRILIQRADVSDYTYQPYPGAQYPNQDPPKYDDGDPSTLYGDPYAQIDRSEEILPGDDTFRADGY